MWRNRWAEASGNIAACEAEEKEKDYRHKIVNLLSDNPRSGTPPTFSAEQICQIVALACDHPSQSGRPITHWTPRELADESMKLGIVYSISPRHDVFDAEVKQVCDLYQHPQELAQQYTHLVSYDEMTGIQATERKTPTKPMRPGIIERQEFEYIRHGTLSQL